MSSHLKVGRKRVLHIVTCALRIVSYFIQAIPSELRCSGNVHTCVVSRKEQLAAMRTRGQDHMQAHLDFACFRVGAECLYLPFSTPVLVLQCDNVLAKDAHLQLQVSRRLERAVANRLYPPEASVIIVSFALRCSKKSLVRRLYRPSQRVRVAASIAPLGDRV